MCSVIQSVNNYDDNNTMSIFLGPLKQRAKFELYETTRSKFRAIICIFLLFDTNENASYSSELSVSRLLFYSLT